MSACSRCNDTGIVVKPSWQEACPNCSPPKTFDAEVAQEHAAKLRHEMRGNYYRHYKGGLYYVSDVVVDEVSGLPRVDYRSMDKKTTTGEPYKWSRLHSVFTEFVSGKPRFERTAIDGNVHGE